MMKKKKVIFINRMNTDNFGDKIIYRCMRNLFGGSFKNIHLDFSFCPIKYSNNLFKRIVFKLLKPLYLFYCVRKISNAEAIVIGGGELISSSVGFFKSLCTWDSLFKKYFKGNCILFFSVGISGLFTKEQEEKAKKMFEKYTFFFFRDNKSIKIAKKLIDNKKIAYVPDCVFSMIPAKSKHSNRFILLGLTSLDRHNKHGVLSFCDEEAMFDYYYRLIKSKKTSDVFLFFNDLEDRTWASRFNEYMKRKYSITFKLLNLINENDLVNAVSEASEVISPRMHACIIALLYGIKVKPVCISEKMLDFKALYLSHHIELSKIRNSVYEASKIVIDLINGVS